MLLESNELKYEPFRRPSASSSLRVDIVKLLNGLLCLVTIQILCGLEGKEEEEDMIKSYGPSI